jgi:hypothetical protein
MPVPAANRPDMEIAFWLAAPLLLVYALHRLTRHFQKRRTQADYQRMPAGSAYNPLQELVEPQSRHIVQVAEERAPEEHAGGDQ